MKQNIIFWIGVRSSDPSISSKHGNFEYLEYSKQTWQYWCTKHDVLFVEYTTPKNSDTGKHLVTWQRWFDVFDQVESLGIDYNKIAVVDGSSMIHWNAPNIFNLVSENLVAFRSLENLQWIYEGMTGYRELFDSYEFNINEYISCGFQIFNHTHKKFLIELKAFYLDNYEKIMQLQHDIRRGTDQPIYNYLLQIKNVKIESLPLSFMITHLNRFDWFRYNWQLNEDMTPYFIKYGYIWFFSGFDRTMRLPLMQQTWELIKHNYE
jgi:hypothetical protein